MKTKNILFLVVVVAVLIILFYSFTASQDPTAYLEEIKKERVEKDEYMRSSSASPFQGRTREFKGLSYFPPDRKYKVQATLTPIENKQTLILMTNDGKEEHYLDYAFADFELNGKQNRLRILEAMDGDTRGRLFLAFGDETSAKETYGAGRYIDVRKAEGSNTITLDFNKAYNPYCAYASTYSCPMPPKENLLSIPILAGEKTYDH